MHKRPAPSPIDSRAQQAHIALILQSHLRRMPKVMADRPARMTRQGSFCLPAIVFPPAVGRNVRALRGLRPRWPRSSPRPGPIRGSVDSHVARIRRKLGEDGQEPRFIQTVHGVGYAFREDVV